MTLAAVCTALVGEEAVSLQTLDATPLGPASVRIAVRAASVNFPDVLMIRGLYQFRLEPPFVPGSECAGVITEVGDDVAVFGLPDPEMGEYVHALVQPAEGVEGSAALAEDVLLYAREHLARYKVPRVVDFRAELPRLPTGKLYKQSLRDEYRAALA